MALYIDSAFLSDIISVAQTIPLAGVTTNPSIVLAARERGQNLDMLNLVRELQRIGEGFIFVQSGATTEEELLKDVVSYIDVDPLRVVPKLPMTQVGMRVALRLRKANRQRIAFTAVTSLAQAYNAAMAGADFIIPYYNRLERAGVDASERVAQMAELLHNQQLGSRILAASIKTASEAERALMAGAHDLTIAPEVLLGMVQDAQSEQAVEKFAVDWHKMKNM